MVNTLRFDITEPCLVGDEVVDSSENGVQVAHWHETDCINDDMAVEEATTMIWRIIFKRLSEICLEISCWSLNEQLKILTCSHEGDPRFRRFQEEMLTSHVNMLSFSTRPFGV